MGAGIIIAMVAFFSIITQHEETDTQKLVESFKGVAQVKVEERNGNAVIFFQDATFASGESSLSDQSLGVANQVANELATNFSTRLLYVEGHTDSLGSHALNKKLSNDRATAVANVILNNGYDVNKIKIIGYVDKYPECTNETEVGRSCNRRVQIAVITGN